MIKELKEKLAQIVEEKLAILKVVVALDEANVQKMGRTKLIKARVRGGKIQRRKKSVCS